MFPEEEGMTQAGKEPGHSGPHNDPAPMHEAPPRKRHPLGIVLVGTLTAIGGLALLLME